MTILYNLVGRNSTDLINRIYDMQMKTYKITYNGMQADIVLFTG